MAGSIKGITVEISGNATKLDKALKDVNKSAKTTETQLRGVEKALRMDPGNVDLIKDKHMLLGQQIQNTKEKLDTLKRAESEQVKAGAANTDDFKALEIEIDQTAAKLKQLKEEDKGLSFPGLKAASENVKDFGDKVGKVGSTLTKDVTAPIAVVGAASGAAFEEVDTAMDNIVKKTGASGDSLTSMQNIAKGMAETIPTTFETASDAVAETNVRFGLTGDELQNLSTQFVEFADVNNTDVTSSVESLQQVMSAFGVDASDAGNMLGLFTSVSQETGVSVDDLMSSLQSNGATFRDMGLSAAESTTLLGNFEAAGIDDATAMTAMKKAAANFQSQGISLSDGLKDIIGRLSDGEVTTQDYTDAMDIFGKKGGDAFVDMAKSGRLSLDNLQTDLSQYGSTVDDTFNGTLDPIDKAKTAFNQLKDIGASIFESIESVLAPVLQAVSDKLKEFKGWWDALDPSVKENIIKFALLAAAIGPVLLIVQKLSGVIAGVLQHPILALIAAAVAGLVALYNTCEPFRDFINNIWDTIKGFFTDTNGGLAQIQSAVSPVLDSIGQAFQGLWSQLQPALAQLWSALQPVLQVIGVSLVQALQFLWQIIQPLLQGIVNAIAPIITAIGGALTFITGLLTAFFDLLTGDTDGAVQALQTAWGGVVTFFQGIWDAIVQLFTGVWASIETLLTGSPVSMETAWSQITSFFQTLWDGIVTIFTTIWTTIQNVWNGAVAFFQGLITSIGTIFQNIFTIISVPFQLAWEIISAIWSAVQPFFQAIWDGISAIFAPVAEWFSNVFSTAWNAIQTAWSAVTGFFSGIWDGIVSVFSAVSSWFGEQFSAAWTAIEAVWSAVVSFFQGIWDGIVAVFSAVASWFSDQFNQASSSVQESFSPITGFFQGIWDGICGVFSGVAGWFGDKFQGAVDSIHNVFSGIGDWFANLFSGIHIPLPHFSVSGSFSLNPPSIPSIGVSWYANGAILKQPTIFGMNGGNAMVGGEAGPEAIAPISELQKYLGNSGKTYNVYIDGIKYNDGDAIDSRITDFVDEIVRRGRMYSNG